MKLRGIAILFGAVASLLLAAGSFYRDPGVGARSRIIRLEPDTGRPGDVITAFGEQLDRPRVEDICLTDGERTALVTIIQQNDVSIRFRIPAKLASGRYKVVLVIAGRYYHGIEQQVILTVL
jgi:hypothetical protein